MDRSIVRHCLVRNVGSALDCQEYCRNPSLSVSILTSSLSFLYQPWNLVIGHEPAMSRYPLHARTRSL